MIVFIVVPKNSRLRKYNQLALSFLDNVDPSKIIEVRGEDVPSWIKLLQNQGRKAIGFTGEDLYKEYCLKRNALKVIKRISWDDKEALFRKPALCLIGLKDKDLETLPKQLTVCIASKYERIAKKYLNFLERKGFTFKKIYANGSVELMCAEGIADLIIDIVYTGNSIEKYDLKVYDTIMLSDFLIIGGKK